VSSGKYTRPKKFNAMQIKNGLVVRFDKSGRLKEVLGKYGEYGKEKRF